MNELEKVNSLLATAHFGSIPTGYIHPGFCLAILVFIISYKAYKIIKFKYKNDKNKETPMDNFIIVEPEELIKEKNSNSDSNKEKNEELKQIQQYMIANLNGINFYPDYTFSKPSKPKITVVVSVYNNEKYIKANLLSVLNQDFKDIEVIVIDDGSNDKTVDVILGMILKDPRLSLFKNEQYKGNLFTKAKGILKANGKYVLVLDRNDFYLQKNAFSILYEEAEKNNLDILGFASIMDGNIDLYNGEYIHHYYETPILLQPNVSKRMYYNTSDGQIYRAGDVAFNYFVKSELYKKIIKKIDEKYLMRKMDYHEDFLLFFLLTRNAKNLKHIKKIFYFSTKKNITNINNNLSKNNTKNNIENSKCLDSLYYAQFLLDQTNNNTYDKNISIFEFKNWYLNNKCRLNDFTRDEAINVASYFSKNKFIDDEEKRKLFLFIFENVTVISQV